MTRKVTVTYEFPEEVCQALEMRAEREGRDFDQLVADYLAHHQRPRERMSEDEERRRRAAFERHFGSIRSGNRQSSDNDQIDADLAREYGGSK